MSFSLLRHTVSSVPRSHRCARPQCGSGHGTRAFAVSATENRAQFVGAGFADQKPDLRPQLDLLSLPRRNPFARRSISGLYACGVRTRPWAVIGSVGLTSAHGLFHNLKSNSSQSSTDPYRIWRSILDDGSWRSGSTLDLSIRDIRERRYTPTVDARLIHDMNDVQEIA